MTNKEILEKAIEKAYQNGWGKGVDAQKLNWVIAHDMNFMYYQYWYSIIFSHDFAKAFWGEEPYWVMKHYPRDVAVKADSFYSMRIPNWKYKLQQMALEEDRLKYLEKFL